jgi:hypothetical protein
MTFSCNPVLRTPVFAICLIALAGCSDTNSLETGGGAGDLEPDSEAVALIAPFAGIYDLPDDWSGNPPDEAFLQIQQPNSQGVAIAALFDQDDINSCIPDRPDEGVVTRDLFGDQVFMDDILAFNQSILTLQGTTLVISFQDDFDLDNDADTSEFISLEANRIGVMSVNDLGPTC